MQAVRQAGPGERGAALRGDSVVLGISCAAFVVAALLVLALCPGADARVTPGPRAQCAALACHAAGAHDVQQHDPPAPVHDHGNCRSTEIPATHPPCPPLPAGAILYATAPDPTSPPSSRPRGETSTRAPPATTFVQPPV